MYAKNLWAGVRLWRLLTLGFAVLGLATLAAAQVAGTALTNRVNGLSGRVEGSVQQNLANGITMNGGAVVTGDLLVLGLPSVTRNGTPTYAGTIDGTGAATPTGYSILLNSGATLNHVMRRTNTVALTPVGAPPTPKGTRSVNIGSAGQSVGSWTTLRNLTLNGGVGQYTVPAGAYGDFVANSGSSLVLGVVGATQPSVYSFHRLTLNGLASLRVVGPVQIRVGSAVFSNGPIGNADHPAWLELKIQTGGFTLNSGAWLAGYVFAPTGEVMINSNTQLIGGVECDRLTVNGGGVLRLKPKTPANQPPVANSRTIATDEDTAVSFALTGSDPDGQALTFTVVSNPATGVLLGTAPNLTYTPPADFVGTTTFTFKVNDGVVDSTMATVTLEVRPVNDRPVAQALAKTTQEDTAVAITLAGTDVETPVLTFSVVQPPTHGTLSGSGAALVYTPAPDYFGPDEFLYVANDGALDSIPAVVSITVIPVNDAPVAAPQSIVTDEDVPVAITLTGSDPEGLALLYTLVSGPLNGTITGTLPNLIYSPAADFFGSDEFVFRVSDGALVSAPATVSITVRSINDAPVARPLSISTPEDTATPVVLGGHDPEGAALTFTIVSMPTHGSLTGAGASRIYTPAPDYSGPDSFTYLVSDGLLSSAPAAAAITVAAVNDCPIPVPVSVSTPEDTPAPVLLVATDADGDLLAFAIVTGPAHGALSPSTSTSTSAFFTYTPSANYNGADAFTYTVSDGACTTAPITVPITVEPVNDAPAAADLNLVTDEEVAVAAVLTGTDVDGDTLTYRVVTGPGRGTLSGSAPTLTYRPSADWSGTDSFTYVVNDGTVDSASATVLILVRPINDCPDSAAAPVSTREDIAVPVELAAIDRDSATLTFAIVDAPAHGVLSRGTSTSTSASFTYTPAANYSGPDAFTYTVRDGLCTTDPITVPITVEPVNDAPTADPQSLETPEDAPLPITLTGTDPEGTVLGFQILTQPQHGTLTPGTSADRYVYTPAANWSGSDSFTFTVSDGQLTSAVARVGIVVTPVNDRPVAIGDTIRVRNDATAPVELRGTDIEGDTLTFTVVTQPTHGTLSGTAPQLVYTPNRSYLGADAVEFRVSDGSLDSAVAVIVIDVVAGNTAPTANPQSLETDEDKALPVVLTGTDAERDTLSFTIVDQPRHGSLSGTAPNLVYTPVANYSGPDSFTFKVADATDESVPATVSITVKLVNAPPVVDVGADSAITLPAYGMVVGTATDPDGDALTLLWSQVSGPAKVDFETPAALSTRISITTPGSYVFRLTAADGIASASDELTVVANSSSLVSRTYTTTADFETGTRTNVFSKVPDQLELNEVADAGNFLWVAVSSKGTIVKINTRTGKVEGEYWTSPNGQPKNPSRTTVDLNGAVWCTNRAGNSVVQVGSVESGMWIDKNGNGQPDTSTGLGNVRAWSNAGDADTNGGVSTAEDECIINYTRVSSGGTRHICVDRKNNIWVTGTDNRVFDYIDSKSGKILRSEGPALGGYGGYGGVIDRNGVIWSTSWGSLLRWDTSKPLTGPVGENWMTCAGGNQYGLALGPDGYVWASGYGAGTVYKYAPDGTLVGQYTQGNSAAQGLTVDRRGHVWVAHSSGSSTVGHLAPNGTWLGNVTVGSGPTGVAVDADGRIWATNHNSGTVSRIDPNAGPLGADGLTPVGAVDFTSVSLGGNLYNYSDMTGSTLTAPPLTGVWTTVFDSAKGGTAWGSINWHAEICDDAKVTLTVCSSVDGVTYSPWRVGVRGQDLDVPDGRYLKLNVLLQRASSGKTPVLYDVTIGEQGYMPDYPFNTAPRIETEARQAANYGVEAALEATVWDDGLPYPSKLTYHWSQVSGPGTVSFDDPDWVKPTATFSAHGSYVLRLTASDGLETVSRDVTIVANTPPSANAGPDLGVREAGGSISFQGAVWDDGASLSGLVSSWSQISGPANAVLADVASPKSLATFPVIGRYMFELTVSDGWAQAKDTVEVRVGPPTNAQVPRDAAVWWPFNADYRDVIHGIIAQPARATLQAGFVGRALTLNGASAYAMTAEDPNLDIASGGSFTAELWARSEENRDYPRLLSWGAVEGVRLYQNSGRLYANFRDGAGAGTDHEFYVDSVLPVNAWVHVAITYDKATGVARIYVNGVIKAAQAIGSFTPQTTGPLYFARPNSSSFKGQLDEVSLYRRALLPQEIDAIYESGAVGKAPADNNVAPVVDAGPDHGLATAAESVTLSGQVVDDGLPAGSTVLSRWAQVSGPGTAVFADASQAATSATFDRPGIYVLKLSADDTLIRSEDYLGVRVGMSTEVPKPTDLMAWWPANRTTEDVVSGIFGIARDLGFGLGKVGDAFNVAADGLMLVPGRPGTDVAAQTAGFTIEYWMNAGGASADGNLRRLLAWTEAGTSEKLRIGRYNHLDWVRVEDGAGHSFDLTGIPEGVWTHVAFTYDRSAKRMIGYINGVAQVSVDASAFVFSTVGDLSVGGSSSRPANEWFNGQLDEVSFFSRPLGGGEIAQIYNTGLVGKAPLNLNQAPIVNAGPDTGVAGASGAVNLHGSVADDGLPVGPGLFSEWKQAFGPAVATIGSPLTPDTIVSLTAPGIYGFQLSADDGLARRSDVVEVRVGMSTEVPTPTDLMAWWPANRTTEDVVSGIFGIARDLGFGLGKVGDAFNVAADGLMLVPGRPGTDVAAQTAGFTIEYWMNAGGASADGNLRRLLAWTEAGTSEKLRIGRYNHLDWVRVEDGAGHSFDLTGISEGVWTHVAFTYDRSAKRMIGYINGVAQVSVDASAYVLSTVGDLSVGGSSSRPANEWFNGQLDEVSFFSRPLGGGEIAQIYNTGLVGKAPLNLNQAPIVNAGPDTGVAGASGAVNLHGSVADDGLPVGPGLFSEWKQAFGPAVATIGSPLTPDTIVSLTAPGIYGFQLSADDGLARRSDVVEVRVGMSTEVPTPTDLMAWWPANRTTEDVVSGIFGIARDLGFGLGKVGDAFNVAADGLMLVPGRPGTDVAAQTAGFTIEYWMNAGGASADGNLRRLLAWTEAGTSEKLRIGRYNHLDWVRVEDGAGHSFDLTGISEGVWTHVAFTYDRSAKRMIGYINGVAQVSVDASAYVLSTVGDLSVGGSSSRPANEWFNGQLDEVSFYSRPLAAAEIAAVHAAGADGKAPIVYNLAPRVVAAVSGSPVAGGAAALLSANVLDDGLPNPPAALTYEWSKVSGPGSVAFSAPTGLNTTATFSAAGSYMLRCSASDSLLSGTAAVVVTVTPPLPIAEFVSPVDGGTVGANTALTLIIRASDADGMITKVEFFRDGASLGLGGQVVGQPNQYGIRVAAGFPLGAYVLTAKVTDNSGLTATTAPVTITAVADPGIAPVAHLLVPDAGSVVSASRQILGVVHSDILASWRLEYRLRPAVGVVGDSWVVLASGANNMGELASGSDGSHPELLATLDPTRLLNGIYELRVVAADSVGRITIGQRPNSLDPSGDDEPYYLVVEGNLKLGVLSESHIEVSLPAPGFPLEVIRHYDSRDPRIGDFGVGGTLASTDFRIQKSMLLGERWFAWSDNSGPAGFPVCMLEPGVPQNASVGGVPPMPRTVTITLPTDVVYRFTARMVPNRQALAPIEAGRLVFDPMPGTVGTLVPLDDSKAVNDDVILEGSLGEVNLLDYATAYYYDPSVFRLTLNDGTSYIIDAVLGVLEMTDPNGNRIEYHEDRIVHSCGLQLTLIRDSAGCITKVLDPLGNEVNYTYDAQHRLISVTDRAGKATTFGYSGSSSLVTSVSPPAAVKPTFNVWDGFDRFVARVDALVNRIELGYDAAGYQETKKDQLGNVTTYQMDDYGRMQSTTDPLGGVTRYSYGDSKNPLLHTAVSDPLHRITRYAYNSMGLATAVTDPLGNVTTFAYNAQGRVTQETDPLGHSVVSTYDAAGNTLSVTDRDGAVHAYTYDGDGNVLTAADPLGEKTTFTYSSQGLPLTEETRAAGGALVSSRTFTYDIYGNRTTETTKVAKADGSVQDVTIRHTYDLIGNPLVTTYADGTTLVRTYDGAGRLASETDRLGHATQHEYDAGGRKTKSTFWDGTAETAVLDAKGRVTSVTDRRGNVTATDYDPLDRVTKTTLPDGSTTAAVFDLAGQLVSETNETGQTTAIAYDLGGRPTTVTHPDGTTTDVGYDAVGNTTEVKPRVFLEAVLPLKKAAASIQSMTAPASRRAAAAPIAMAGAAPAPAGPRYVMAFDAARRVTEITNPDGTTAAIAYDLVGRPTSTTNERGATWTYEYSDSRAVARSRVTGPLGYSEQYIINALACITSRTDALGRKTLSDYPSDKYQPNSISYPDGTSEVFTYDDKGRMTKLVDRRGNTTDYTFAETSAGGAFTRTTTRLVTVEGTNPDSASTTPYTTTEDFDEVGNLRKSVENDGLGTTRTTSHTYDWVNRRTSTTLPDGTEIKTVYGPGGRIDSVVETTTAGVRTTSYAYDANAHVTKITHPDGTFTGYEYAADGRLLKLTDPRGGVTAYSYNDSAHIVYATDPVGATTTRTYDALGNLLSEKDALGHATTYAYDALGRRSSVTDAIGNTTTFAFDLAGNVLTVADPLGRIASYTGYDANNRPAGFALTGSVSAPGSATIGYGYDAVGNRTSLSDPLGRQTAFAYDELSRLYRTTLPSGMVRSTRHDLVGNPLAQHEYDPAHSLPARTIVQTFDRANRVLSRTLPPLITTFGERPVSPAEQFSYDGYGRLSTHQDVRLSTTSYTYDGVTDRVRAVALPGGGSRSFTYDAMGNPIAITDARGIVTSQQFDAAQRLTRRSVGGARTTTYGYDGVGNVTDIAYPSGQTVSSDYDALRRVTRQSVLLDAATSQQYLRSFDYDGGGRLRATTDNNGTTQRTYDFQDRVLTVAEPLGRSLSSTYNAAGDLLSTTDDRGGVTTYAYDTAGRPASVTDAEGGVRSLAFDVFDQIVSEELGASRTTYEYDAYGRAVRATRQGNAAETVVSETLWGPTGLLMATRDPAGFVTTHTYNSKGYRTGTAHPDGSSEAFTYDDEGSLLTSTDELGRTRRFAHNSFGEIASVTDATGSVTAYSYDGGGRVTSIKDPTGRTTAYAYDEAGRLRSTTLPDGTSVSTRSYDEFGNLTGLTDPDGRRTTYEYDQLNRMAKARVPIAAATAAETLYGYDTANNLSSILDPLNRRSTFTHDRLNRLTAVYLPNSGATPHERLDYDVRGLPTKRTDAAGYATTMAYDALGRLIRTQPDGRRGEPTITASYDVRGLRTAMTDGLGTTSYAYDTRGRLLSKATPAAGTLAYNYDAAGNLSGLSSSVGGVSLGYTYDNENRLATVVSRGGVSDQPESTTYTRDSAGRPLGITLPNGSAETRTYDTNGLLASVSTQQGGAPQTRFAVARNRSGQVSRSDEELAGTPARRTEFTYDWAGRLTSESALLAGPIGSLNYSLDLSGNRLGRSGQLGTLGAQSFTFDDNNALTDGTYDDNGNTATAHPTEPAGGFSYDFRDALRTRTPALTAEADRVEFLHDGDGRRVGRRELDSATGRWKTTHYLVAEVNPTGFDQVFAEVREGSLVRSYAYGEQRLSLDGFVENQVRGGRHSLALDASGQVWAWGDNSQGQLGLGTTDGSSDTPVPVPGLTNVAALAAGGFHSVALRADGTVWVWGGNDRGQLGLGAGVSATAPTQISGLSDVVAISTHLDHTLALTLDGEVWAWGVNDRGQLGDGSTADRPTPAAIAGLVATDIAVGQTHSAARKADGSVFVWGDNTHGQLGNGTAGSYAATPAAVSALTTADRLVAGGFHTLVRRSDGTVLAWGGNAYGQLGDGSKQDRTAPVAITSAAQATALAAGSRHSLALLADGTVLAWGDNREGQLGLGSVADSVAPARIVGLSGVTEIAAGGRRSLARSGSALMEWGDGRYAPATAGTGLSLASLGGEAGADPLSYNLGLARAFYAYDPQGNVRALTDRAGALSATYTYDAYGNLLAQTSSSSSNSTSNFNPYLFQGERYEAAAGLYHLRARDYDPRLGRFQQLDSFPGVAGLPFSHNRYAYAEADPVNLHDPSGHFACTIWGAVQLLEQQVAYNDYICSIGPKERLLDLSAMTYSIAHIEGPRPQLVQRERPIWLTAAGTGSILGSLQDESGAATEDNYTRGLGVGSDVFFLAQTGAPFRQSLVERLVDSAWLATQRAWPNLNTGPKMPNDVRLQFSRKWQNRWPDVVYHNAILQGALRSALLGREVEVCATVTFRPPMILLQTRSASALRALNGVSGGGPLDWRAPAPSPQGSFLSHVARSGWEYGQMEMMKEWSAAALGSDAYRFANLWAEVGARLPGEALMLGASMIPGGADLMDVRSSLYGETALERNIARASLFVSAVTGGLSPNFGRIGRVIAEVGGNMARLSRRTAQVASHGSVSALRIAERGSLAVARYGSRALGRMAGGARTAGNYASALEKGYMAGLRREMASGRLYCSGADAGPVLRPLAGAIKAVREHHALRKTGRLTGEVAEAGAAGLKAEAHVAGELADDVLRAETKAAGTLTDAAENGVSDFTRFKGFAGELRDLGINRTQRRQILENIRDNFTNYGEVSIGRISRERSFWRRWGQYADGTGARELGRYGSIGPRSVAYNRDKLAVLEPWNTLKNQTRFRIRKGGLLIEGPTALKTEASGLVRPGGGWQLYVPDLDDLSSP